MKPSQFQKAYGMSLDAFGARVKELVKAAPDRLRDAEGQVPRGEMLAHLVAGTYLERWIVSFLVTAMKENPITVAELVEHAHAMAAQLMPDDLMSRAVAAQEAEAPPDASTTV